MTLRRATLLVHCLLVALFVGGAASLAWLTLTYTPDPDEDFPFGPGFIAIPMALGLLVVAGAVGWLVRMWARTGNRGLLALADVVAALVLLVVPLVLPPPMLLAALATVAVAGGFVAANKPVMATEGQVATMPSRRGPGISIVAAVVIAVVVGLMLAGPLLVLTGTPWIEL